MGGDAKLTNFNRPLEFGEAFETPVRTLLVLRSWTVWRARHAGWACARPETSRKHIIDEEESCIERAVRALCEPCGLLGNRAANKALTEVAPTASAESAATNVWMDAANVFGDD